MRNVTVDLETVSLANNPALLSIGAVKFDATGLGETFYRQLDLGSSLAVGLTQDASTMKWWRKQSREAYREAFSGQTLLVTALADLAAFLGNEPVIWGNGAIADNVWLASAYAACDLEKPWAFYNDRCFRTVAAMHPSVTRYKPLIAHNALEDAIAQALTLVDILNIRPPLEL